MTNNSKLRSIGVRPNTKKKLNVIRRVRGWPFIDAIERMADREIDLIKKEREATQLINEVTSAVSAA